MRRDQGRRNTGACAKPIVCRPPLREVRFCCPEARRVELQEGTQGLRSFRSQRRRAFQPETFLSGCASPSGPQVFPSTKCGKGDARTSAYADQRGNGTRKSRLQFVSMRAKNFHRQDATERPSPPEIPCDEISAVGSCGDPFRRNGLPIILWPEVTRL